MTLLLGIAAAALLSIAGYAHYRVPFHTAEGSRTMLTRGVLALVGLAFGYVMAAYYAGPPSHLPLVFLAGFGAVHVPAAIILFVKRARGEGKS
jgi:hypothetical protein